MIHVLAMITAHPGKRAEVLRLFQANVPAVLAEEGCLQYEAAVDQEGALGRAQALFGPDTFVVIERWDSLDALKAHARAPHMVEYAAKTGDLVAARAIHVLSPQEG